MEASLKPKKLGEEWFPVSERSLWDGEPTGSRGLTAQLRCVRSSCAGDSVRRIEAIDLFD
uniref:Uncharacterized protein MANES_05G186800 n=1 Tax=Rhizophora mucronata TaxID=61149 RepID=A0A2P2QA73_RHIMU